MYMELQIYSKQLFQIIFFDICQADISQFRLFRSSQFSSVHLKRCVLESFTSVPKVINLPKKVTKPHVCFIFIFLI